MILRSTLTILLVLACHALPSDSRADNRSVYTERPADPEATFFTPEDFGITADGDMDVSEALQHAINQVKTTRNYGILFIPEGTYRINTTIYVPPAVRLIGYGERRPAIVLGAHSPGFGTRNAAGEDAEHYMIWFTGNMVQGDDEPRDANPGTFYSAISNIDLRIEDGNPNAVALRTRYAQHGFVSHAIIDVGSGKAGISQLGNEMENVEFRGGDYGIVTGPTSPSWPMMMVDTRFSNQRRAAIRSHNSGLTIVNMHVRDVPVILEVEEGATDRIFMENCLFENVAEAALVLNAKPSALNQLSLLDVAMKNVPRLARFRDSGELVDGQGDRYLVREFTHGLVMDDLAADSEFRTIVDIDPPEAVRDVVPSRTVPALPPMSEWVSVKDLGAVGDGETDDTEAFRRAIAAHDVIYVPQGWYRVTGTVKMRPGTKLIGLHPWATQLVLHESEPAFSGFGGPVPMLESSEGGDDVLNGIGISTGGYNYRAVGLKWMAGEASLVNDVKFVGGHGTMRPPSAGPTGRSGWSRGQISTPSEPAYHRGPDRAWDNQFWSLWVTNGGGGTFKDIWTANTYAASGMLVSDTSTPGSIYAMSIEHHVRNEVTFRNVSNWRMYAFQFEEEYNEGIEAQMLDVVDSSDLLFASLWMYRTIRVQRPKRFGMRLWNSSDIRIHNLRNYTQKLWVTEFPVWDVNKELAVYPWELARLTVTGEESGNPPHRLEKGEVRRLASGFDFAQGLTADSEGNVYFVETRRKRIYKWSAATRMVTMIADFPFPPFALATDTEDNLLVVARYDPQPGYLVNGEQERVRRLPDDNPAYSSWGNSGWAAYAYSIDPNDPDDTFRVMPRVATAGIEEFDRTYYPSSRWHYTFDDAAVYYPDSAFAAPDGVTFIHETYDIGRTADLSAAVPGGVIHASDEIGARTVRMDVGEMGRLSNLREILPHGETSTAVDKEGRLYVAAGQIFAYDENLNELGRINLPERPISITIGGEHGSTLFITTVNSLYAMGLD